MNNLDLLLAVFELKRGREVGVLKMKPIIPTYNSINNYKGGVIIWQQIAL